MLSPDLARERCHYHSPQWSHELERNGDFWPRVAAVLMWMLRKRAGRQMLQPSSPPIGFLPRALQWPNANVRQSCCLVTQSCLTSYDPHGLQHARLPCPSKRQGNLLIRGQSPWAEESGSGCINGSHAVKQCRVSQMEAAGAWRQNQPCPWYVTQTFPVALFLHPSSKGDDTKVPWRVPFRNDQ